MRSVHLWLVLPLALAGCQGKPGDRAFSACKTEVSRHLVMPSTGTFSDVTVEPRGGDGEDGWLVHFRVTAKNGTGGADSSRLRCAVNGRYEVVDLGER